MADIQIPSDFPMDPTLGGQPTAPSSTNGSTTPPITNITKQGSYPTGIPDPAHPGYDTGGYLLGSKVNPDGTITIPNASTGMTSQYNPVTGSVAASQTAGGGGGGAPTAYPQTIAPFSGVNYPQFTPPPLPDALKNPFQLPSAQDLIANDPGYKARFDLGQQAIQRSAAAQGSILNPDTQLQLQRAGQDYASNEYNNFVQQKLAARQQQASDYLGLAYGPSWQQNQAAVNQYGDLYKQYQDLIGNNRNAQQDYVNALLAQERIGVGAAGSAGAPASGTGTGL